MQLTVLGCWAPYPRPGEACSGYLLRAGDTTVMLEAGNGSFAELARHVDFRRLSGLVITHFHPDHYADVFCLRHAIEGARRADEMNGPVKLFIPPEPADIYAKLASYTEAFDVVNVEELPETTQIPGGITRKALLNDLALYFIHTAHSLPGYAVLFLQKDKTVFFSGDTAPTEAIERAAQGAGLFLCEASGLDKDAGYLANAHMTAREAGTLARRAGAKRLVITHFWPEYALTDLLNEAGRSFGGAVEAAKQGKTYML